MPDNPDIERTYQFPDISSGFIWDMASMDVSPSLQVELFEWNTKIDRLGRLKLDFGVAYQRAYVYFGKLWTSIFEISTGIWAGWNFDDMQFAYGIGFTVIKF